MSPAGPASEPDAVDARLVRMDLLGPGEAFILAIKPSGWFVPLVSLPVIISALVVGAGAAAINAFTPTLPREAILLVTGAAVIGRLLYGCWQWMGRTYVLTNRRMAILRGMINVEVQSAPLGDLDRAATAASLPDRLVGTGSVYTLRRGDAKVDRPVRPAIAWTAVARPEEVREIVEEAIRHVRHKRGDREEGQARA
jgi:hypothetical protein